MKFSEIKKDLLELEIYKKRINFSYMYYDVFYIIIDKDDEIVKFNCKLNQEKEYLKSCGNKYTSYSEFILNEYEEKFALNIFNLEVYIYCIPRDSSTSHDLKNIYTIYSTCCYYESSLLKSFSFIKLKKNIKKYYKFYLYVYIVYILIYNMYLYYGLNEIGMTFNIIKDVELLLATVGMLVFILILPLSFSIYSAASIMYLIMLFFVALLLLYKKYTKKPKMPKTILLYEVMVSFKDIIFFSFFAITILALLMILFYPITNMLSKYNMRYMPKSKPYILIDFYREFTGYPKIIEYDNKKYIAVGHDNKQYYIYDLKKTKKYLGSKNNDNINFCKDFNSNSTYNNYNTLAVLIYSKYNRPASNIEYISRDKEIITRELTLKYMDINISKLCKFKY